MAERDIENVAAANGLKLEKRITTGDERRHFATFELSGDPVSVLDCWQHDRGRLGELARIRSVTNSEHPDHSKPYIEIESVWCESP